MSTTKDRFLTVLFFLFTTYSAILIGIFKLINYFNSNPKVTEISFLPVFLNLIFLIISMIIIINLIIVIISAIVEFKTIIDARKGNKKVENFFRKEVLNSPSNIFANKTIIFLGFLILISYLVWWVAIDITIILIIVFYISKKYIQKNKIFSSKYELNKIQKITIMFLAVLIITVIYLLIVSITYYSAGFEIKQKNEFQTINENAFISIYPKGIIKPEIINITYSNKEIPLNYESNSKFLSSPAFIIINKHNLTNKPYNSFITIRYKLSLNLPKVILPKYYLKKEFVPVFPK